MHVRGISGQQDASVAVHGGLTRHVGEPGNPGGIVDPVVGAVGGDERVGDIAQCGFAGGYEVTFGKYDPDQSAIFHPADRVLEAEPVLVKPPLRLLERFDFGDQPARRRIPPGNSMRAALRIRLRPPSHPTRYSARSD